MPFEEVADAFHDMLDAISKIEEYIGASSFEEYVCDYKTKDAVERRVLVVSEAAYRLKDEAAKLIPGHDWAGLRGMGNVIRHAYDGMDDQITWNVVKVELPDLRAAILNLLASGAI